MLLNVCSLENKLDLIQLSRSTQHETRDCCVFVFTETWLNDTIPDSAIQLHGLSCCRADRDSSLSGKTLGGGLCVYINKEWCNNAAVLSKHCSSLVEFMDVECRPFYLPREFTAIVIVAVYIPRVQMLRTRFVNCTGGVIWRCALSEQKTNDPGGFFIIASDFNHANLKTVLPKFYQHVNFATRGNNTLDFVYTTVKYAFKAEPRPHLGYSDHISVMLTPAYRPLLKLAKPVQKQITVWPDAKRSYAKKINNHFTDNRDSQSLWQAIQTITDYKPPPQACDDETSFPDAFNHFYSRFEMQNDTPAQKLPTPPNDQALCLSPADVRKTLSRINPRKAAGPDNIPGSVLKDCAEQLTDVFNRYLQHLAEPCSHPHMSQIHDNHTGTKKITCVLSKRLPSHSTDSNNNEVL